MDKYTKKIVLFVNSNEYTIQVDLPTYYQLIADEEVIYQYVKNLIENGFIDETGIKTLGYTVGNETEVKMVIVDDEELTAPENQNSNVPSEVSISTNDVKENAAEDNSWTDQTTKLLLDKYEEYLANVGPMKRFKKKKQLWEQIAKDLASYCNLQKTSIQCENRYKTILKRKKSSSRINLKSGESRVDVQFENEIDKIKAIDDSVEPEVLISPGKTIIKASQKRVLKKKHDNDAGCSSESGTSRSKKTVTEVLWEIHQNKEEEKNRRHREKMELLKNIADKL